MAKFNKKYKVSVSQGKVEFVKEFGQGKVELGLDIVKYTRKEKAKMNVEALLSEDQDWEIEFIQEMMK